MKRRLFSILTALALCVSMVPFAAAVGEDGIAPQDETVQGPSGSGGVDNGDNIEGGNTGNTGDGTGEDGDVTPPSGTETLGYGLAKGDIPNSEISTVPLSGTTDGITITEIPSEETIWTTVYKYPVTDQEYTSETVKGTIKVVPDASGTSCTITLTNAKMNTTGSSIVIGSERNRIDVNLVLEGNGNRIEHANGTGIEVFGSLEIHPGASGRGDGMYVVGKDIGISSEGPMKIDSSVVVCRTDAGSKAGIVARNGLEIVNSEVNMRQRKENDADWKYGVDTEFSPNGGCIQVEAGDMVVSSSIVHSTFINILKGNYSQYGEETSRNGVDFYWMKLTGNCSTDGKGNFTGLVEKISPKTNTENTEDEIAVENAAEDFTIYGHIELTNEFASAIKIEMKKCEENGVTFKLADVGGFTIPDGSTLDLTMNTLSTAPGSIDFSKGYIIVGGKLLLPAGFDKQLFGDVTAIYSYTDANNIEQEVTGQILAGNDELLCVYFHPVGNEADQGGTTTEKIYIKPQIVSPGEKVTQPAIPSTHRVDAWYRAYDLQEQDRWNFDDPVEESMNLYGKLIEVRNPSSGGGSSRPTQPTTPTNPTTPTDPTTPSKPDPVTATPDATVSSDGSAASATVSTALGNELVKQAVDNKSEEIIIAPEISGEVSKTEVTVPAAALNDIAGKTDAVLTVKTPVAQVTLPNEALGELAKDGGSVTVTAQKEGGSIQLSVTANGQTVESISGGVTMTVPHDGCVPGTVAVLVKEDGTREIIRKSLAGEDSVTIPLNGSARIELVDNSKSFQDVSDGSWEKDAVDFVSSHELFNGTSEDTFAPESSMTRGMVAQVLHNLEGNPAQSVSGVFTDVDGNVWYAEAVSWAADKGIVSGYGDGQFGAGDSVSRQDLAVILFRYSGSPAAAEQTLNFTDAGEVSDYAKQALSWAVEAGVLNGKGNGVLDPKGQATRAQVAQMLLNYMAAVQ